MQKLEKKQNVNSVGANCVRPHFEVMTKNQKGITLIALIITIIIMMILVAVTVNLAINGGIFSTARQASKDTEMHAIYDQIIAAMKLTDNGRVDVDETYEQAKTALTSEGKTVEIIESTSEEDITEETTKIVFTVQGKYAKYKYQITGTEVKLIGENEDTEFEEISYNEAHTTVVLADGSRKTYEITGQISWELTSNTDYNVEDVAEIYLGNTVTGIGSPCMSGFINLTKLYIPESVTYIGAGAFGNMDSLVSVTIPSSVIDISVSVFVQCDKLEMVRIKNNPNNLTYNYSQYNSVNEVLATWGNENTKIIFDAPGYQTTLEGLGTGVSLVQYASLTGNLKTAADNGKITAVIEETVVENGETKTLRAVIPTGLTVSTIDGEDTISGGLVVRDGSQNEFVWIPVPEINDMVMCQSAESSGRCTLELQGEILKCTKHNSEELAGRLYYDESISEDSIGYDANLTGQTYNATSGNREPANLTGTYTIQPSTYTGETGGTFAYDSQDAFTRYGGGEYSDTMYQTEFNEMAVSVAKYGGFYVGRYETGGFNESTVVSKPDRGMDSAGGDINNTTWYEMYRMQKYFKRGSTIVGSSMIWGCQYDQVMKFVNGKPDGNGKTFDVTDFINSRHSENYTAGTGNTLADFVANIYDLEGNMNEMTLESRNTDRRSMRGGRAGYSLPAAYRAKVELYIIKDYISSRLALYIR